MSRQVLPPKLQGTTANIPFDFTSALQSGETLVSVTSVLTFLWTGSDAGVSLVPSGASSIVGTKVTQLFTGGVAGNVYEIKVTVTTSLNQILPMTSYIAVVADLP